MDLRSPLKYIYYEIVREVHKKWKMERSGVKSKQMNNNIRLSRIKIMTMLASDVGQTVSTLSPHERNIVEYEASFPK